MIYRALQTPGDIKWFEAWKAKADEATELARAEYQAAFDEGRKPNFDFDKRSTIWRSLKKHLREHFRGKCAYCESKFEKVDVGDVEHFRPKKQVDPQDLKAAEEHPGYYWLAFSHENLLVSCGKCNKWDGKKNRFPIDPASTRARSPDDDLSTEVPLLLNPYFDDPQRHLDFDVETGTVKNRDGSSKGAASIEVYGLNREPLMESRRELIELKWLLIMDRYTKRRFGEVSVLIEAIVQGDEEYSAMLRVMIEPLINIASTLATLASLEPKPSPPEPRARGGVLSKVRGLARARA